MAGIDAEPTWRRFDRRRRIGRFLGVLAALVVFVASWEFLDMGITNVGTVPREIGDLLTRMYPPDVAYVPEIVGPLVETVHIAALGTVGALVLTIPVALLAAENTTPNAATYWLGKLIVTVSRSVNTIIWALIFVVVFGSGPLAGAVAIAFRSIGFLGKLLGEEIEEIDFGQVEAVRAT
ncbi:MAG: PhnE/PtxC family ABC transporter permease, partial [Natrialbaceae archaeon]